MALAAGTPAPEATEPFCDMAMPTNEISGCDPKTTNNRMELTAVIEGLRLLKRPFAHSSDDGFHLCG